MIKDYYVKVKSSSLAKDAGTYTIFNLLEKVVPFIILPIITRYLSPSEFGIYVVYQAFVEFVLPIISLNTDSAILINYFKITKIKFNIYFFNAILIFIVSLIVFSVIFFSFPDFISKWLEFPKEWLWAIVVISAFSYVIRLALNLWQVEKKPKNYGIFSISLTLLRGFLMIFFVVVMGKGWVGVITSQIVAYFIIFIVALLVLKKRNVISPHLDQSFLKDVIVVGAPLTFHQIGSWLSSQGNRIVLNAMLGTAVTGSFGVGAIYGSIVAVIQNSFNKAFAPYLFGKLKNFETVDKIQLVKLTYYYNSGLMLLSILIGIIGYLVNDLIFGSAYDQAKIYIIWVALGNGFNGLYKMHVNYIFFSKKTYYITAITFSTGLLNIFLSYILININGAIGVAQSFLISQFFAYLLSWFYGNKAIKLPWFANKLLKEI